VVAAALKRFHGLLLCLAIAAPAWGQVERTEFRAMGTRIEIIVRDDDPAVRRAALDEARHRFERYGRDWYAWRDDSELARVNRALAGGRSAPASSALIELLHEARTLWCRSGGRFNPAIGGLVELWGFHRPPPYEGPLPDESAIEHWLASDPDPAGLQLGDAVVASDNPAVRLDLGAIAKGAVIDRALAAMRATGLEHAMINAGGDLAVSDALGPDGERHPRVTGRDPPEFLVEDGLDARVGVRARCRRRSVPGPGFGGRSGFVSAVPAVLASPSAVVAPGGSGGDRARVPSCSTSRGEKPRSSSSRAVW
jgi:thiamine biosynthesis lipoprotein